MFLSVSQQSKRFKAELQENWWKWASVGDTASLWEPGQGPQARGRPLHLTLYRSPSRHDNGSWESRLSSDTVTKVPKRTPDKDIYYSTACGSKRETTQMSSAGVAESSFRNPHREALCSYWQKQLSALSISLKRRLQWTASKNKLQTNVMIMWRHFYQNKYQAKNSEHNYKLFSLYMGHCANFIVLENFKISLKRWTPFTMVSRKTHCSEHSNITQTTS